MLKADQLTLRRAGFTDNEINEYQRAVSSNGKPYVTSIDTPLWKDVIQSRKDWMAELEGLGYNREQRQEIVSQYYERKGKADPFDWLKAEYRNPKKQKWEKRKRKSVRGRISRRKRRILADLEPVKKVKQKREKTKQAAKDRQQRLVSKHLRELSQDKYDYSY